MSSPENSQKIEGQPRCCSRDHRHKWWNSHHRWRRRRETAENIHTTAFGRRRAMTKGNAKRGTNTKKWQLKNAKMRNGNRHDALQVGKRTWQFADVKTSQLRISLKIYHRNLTQQRDDKTDRHVLSDGKTMARRCKNYFHETSMEL